ncbi:MAG: hypothetical protein AAF797_03850 [Planctomycetota bacterium]
MMTFKSIATGLGFCFAGSVSVAHEAQAELLLHYAFNNPDTTTSVAADSLGNGLDGAFSGFVPGTGIVTPALQTATGVLGAAGDFAYDGSGAAQMGAPASGAIEAWNCISQATAG